METLAGAALRHVEEGRRRRRCRRAPHLARVCLATPTASRGASGSAYWLTLTIKMLGSGPSPVRYAPWHNAHWIVLPDPPAEGPAIPIRSRAVRDRVVIF